MISKIKTVVICIGLLAIESCTKNFEELNTDETGFTNEQLKQDIGNIKVPIQTMFNNIVVVLPEWKYQVQQGLQADIWSGYMATATPFKGGLNNTTYSLIDGWNGFAWGSGYTDVMANAYKIKSITENDPKLVPYYSLSLILKVEGMHRITDTYGPIVYSKFGTDGPVFGYDAQEEVYKQMFKELDIAVGDLSNRVDAKEKSIYKLVDLSKYNTEETNPGDNYKKWVKFANSLRLRLAMRIVKVSPALAKLEAEKAISQKYGVMTENTDILTIDATHPIKTVAGSWGDISMSADMESIMGGYNDPRLAVFFKISTDYAGQFKGIRTGIDTGAKGLHGGFSSVGSVIDKGIVLMTTAEVNFLRAEGALRGWNMVGSAQELYEKGITASFSQHGVAGASSYITNNVKIAKDYVDPAIEKDKDGKIIYDGSKNNGHAVNKVTVAWDVAVSNEVKLQKIITQKWIANFPEGQEAWSDYRRTGYPKLFPVLVNFSGGKISSTDGVRRLNFVQSEIAGNPGGVATGYNLLGGKDKDNGATRLWWDTTGANF
jgi:Susd and RagB outer membrane lipoprotein